MRKRFFVLLMAAAAVTLPTLAAFATEVAQINITDQHLHVVAKYGPIAGNDPAAGQVQDPTLDQCQTLPGHDAVPIKISISNPATTKATFKTSWDATAQNDIDVYFFQSDGTEIGRSAGSSDPETVNLAGLPDATYWLCAVNFSGVNTGITVDADISRLNLYHYTPPPTTPAPFTPPAETAAPATPLAGAANVAPTTPSVTPEAITTPGPNGPITGQKLDALNGSQQASAHKQGHSALSVALGVATILIAVSGAGVVVVRIRRDTA